MNNGYGRFKVDKKDRRAHRFAYELSVGPVPDGYEVHHTCSNRACCNPAHLVATTVAEHRALGMGFTHCRRGHEYTDANTYVNPKGVKVCRTCMRTVYKRR